MAAIREFNLSNYCALTSPFTFLTGDHLDKSDLIRSRFGFVAKRSGYESNNYVIKIFASFHCSFFGQ